MTSSLLPWSLGWDASHVFRLQTAQYVMDLQRGCHAILLRDLSCSENSMNAIPRLIHSSDTSKSPMPSEANALIKCQDKSFTQVESAWCCRASINQATRCGGYISSLLKDPSPECDSFEKSMDFNHSACYQPFQPHSAAFLRNRYAKPLLVQFFLAKPGACL